MYRVDLRNEARVAIVNHRNGVSALSTNAINIVSCDYEGVVTVTSRADVRKQISYRGAQGELHSVAASPALILWADPSAKGAIQYVGV